MRILADLKQRVAEMVAERVEREDKTKFAQEATEEPRAKLLCLGVGDILLDLWLILEEVGEIREEGGAK